MGEPAHERFNQRVNEHFEGTRDYIVTHYKTNTRTDTDYWRANAANPNLSDAAGAVLAVDVAARASSPTWRSR